MTEIPVDLGGGLVENWNDWVMPGGKVEHDSLPSALKVPLRSLARRPDAFTTPDKLGEYYDDILKLAEDPSSGVDMSDAVPYLLKISDRVKQLASHEKKASYRELPVYIGAAFRGGRNEVLVEDPEIIPLLDITNDNHKWVFMFENVHSFDYLFRSPANWKGAVDNWLTDFDIAAAKHGVEESQILEFQKHLKAMMGVTASARAMEASSGVATTYLALLTGGEKGNLDMQDQWATYLVHADLDKLNLVINNPMVRRYYDKLMEDAGLQNRPDREWRKMTDPDNPGKTIDVASRIVLDRPPGDIRANSVLMDYLSDFASGGGFDKYISDVLLQLDAPAQIAHLESLGFTEDSRRAAARLACDAFLIDKWTRWEELVTEGRSADHNLQPLEDWGGDPLKSILKPSFLPRLKKVYTGDDEVILDLMDHAFRPDDLLLGVENEKLMVVPSMVTHLKKYARYQNAVERFLGGSMATGIPSWKRQVMEEDLPQIADLLTQVYGGAKVKEKGTRGDWVKMDDGGKHLVGAMMMRLLYTKALASTLESLKPDFWDKMNLIFNSEDRDRPFLEALQFLYGPKLDGKAGFVQSLLGGRTRLIFFNNKFDAEKFYEETWNLLITNDQTGGIREAKRFGAISFVFKTARSLVRNFGER